MALTQLWEPRQPSNRIDNVVKENSACVTRRVQSSPHDGVDNSGYASFREADGWDLACSPTNIDHGHVNTIPIIIGCEACRGLYCQFVRIQELLGM